MYSINFSRHKLMNKFTHFGIFPVWDYLSFWKLKILLNANVTWKSEGFLFNTKWAIFQLYHGEHIFDVMMMMSALYYTNMLSWIFIVLAFWNTTPILLHSRHIIQTPSQPVFALNP